MPTNKKFLRSNRSDQCGLSLVEIAIVLSIMGVVITGVWAMATQGWEYTHRAQAEDALAGIVRETRSNYAGQPGIPTGQTAAATTDVLIRNQVISGNLVRNPACKTTTAECIADTPWGRGSSSGGTLRVCGWELGNTADQCFQGSAVGAAPAQFFGVAFLEINLGSCIALAGKISSALGPPGLVEVNINGCNVVAQTGTCANATRADRPIPAAKLNAECASVTPAHVTFVYRMTMPTN